MNIEKKYALGLIITVAAIFLAKYLSEQNTVMVGDKAMNFTYTNMEGREEQLLDQSASYTLLDFWASWCQPCRLGNKKLVNIYKNSQPNDLKIISIGIEKDSLEWETAIEEDSLPWDDQYSSFTMFNDRIVDGYKVTTTPTYFLIDKDENIIAKSHDLEDIKSVLVKKDIIH
ncbi:TlpA family protein disulfide reductase [Membranihabitans marinus]|uniref:TlpA family protein disulfide reductase n=1 Tax=Membranihabitans marinus TaxID=1227546 RepID=UPI001F1F52B4|nr:TlpA disulfide reductase family protein [Membranihabitans marinus]